MLNLYIFIAYRHTNTIITGGGGMGFLFKKLPENHEYDSKTKFKRLKFDLEFSKSDTNVDVKIKYFI
jgi:hypothetical protein